MFMVILQLEIWVTLLDLWTVECGLWILWKPALHEKRYEKWFAWKFVFTYFIFAKTNKICLFFKSCIDREVEADSKTNVKGISELLSDCFACLGTQVKDWPKNTKLQKYKFGKIEKMLPGHTSHCHHNASYFWMTRTNLPNIASFGQVFGSPHNVNNIIGSWVLVF